MHHRRSDHHRRSTGTGIAARSARFRAEDCGAAVPCRGHTTKEHAMTPTTPAAVAGVQAALLAEAAASG